MRREALRLVPVQVRAAAPAVLAGTLGEHLLFAFAAVQLDAIVDWGEVSRRIGELPVPAVGVALALIAWGWARSVARVLPRPAWLRPLPLDPAERAAVVGAPALAAAAPLAAVAALVPATAWPLLALGAAAWVPVLALRGRLAGLAAVALTLGVWVPGAALFGALLALPAAGRAADAATEAGARGWTAPAWAFAGRVRAQVARDGLIATRLAPWSVAGLLVQAVPAFGAERAIAPEGAPAIDVAAVLILAVASLSVLGVLGRASLALGSRFDPPEWPLSPRDRAVGLAASAAVGLAPAWVAVVIAAPAAAVAATCAGAALACGAAWVVAADRQGMDGRFLWWAIAVVAVGAWWGAAPLALAPVAVWRATRALALARP